MRDFWAFAPAEDGSGAELRIEGEIVSDGEEWFDTDVAPTKFRTALAEHPGDLTVWINSPGGDVFAASAIYTALRDHAGKITVKISALAASAASVIAMAGDEVLIAPTAYMLVHNPFTIAMGDSSEMRKVAKMLDTIRDGIVNAYEQKTGMSRDKLERMMAQETMLNAASAVEMGFCDGMLFADGHVATGAAAVAASMPRCVYASAMDGDALLRQLMARMEAQAAGGAAPAAAAPDEAAITAAGAPETAAITAAGAPETAAITAAGAPETAAENAAAPDEAAIGAAETPETAAENAAAPDEAAIGAAETPETAAENAAAPHTTRKGSMLAGREHRVLAAPKSDAQAELEHPTRTIAESARNRLLLKCKAMAARAKSTKF